jgi:predicted glutamine amidotransferase
MCNLNILRSKKGKLLGKAISCINTMGYMSSLHNKDGSGMIARAPTGEISISHNHKGRVRAIGEYDLVATHQRLSTSGHNGKNTHPFTRKHFILMHNGIFYGLGDTKKSDTSKYCDLLEDALEGTNDLIKAIQEVHKDISGSFSILVYDRDKRRFLYYKNSMTSFSGVSTPLFDIYSTDSDNLKYAKWFMRIKLGREIKFKPDII